MKRLRRAPERAEVLDLFADMAVEHGYSLTDPTALSDFVGRVRSSIDSSKKNNTAVFGKRTESLFAYVAGALGKVTLITQEDSGDIFYSGDAVLAPDYRLTFADRKQILIEVKNCHNKYPNQKFEVSKNYFEKLNRYAELNGVDLRFAIFYSSWNQWVLLSIDSFKEYKGSYRIDMVHAMACSEMSTIGDYMLGTAPDLELHLLADINEASKIDESGQAKFITRDIRFYCAGNEIMDSEEKRIAFYLIRYGTWEERETEALVNDEKLIGVKFVYAPKQKNAPNFSLIGHLSSMITNGFREHTIEDGDVVALKLGLDPIAFSALIPNDYKGGRLPLWRFIIQSNPDFQRKSC